MYLKRPVEYHRRLPHFQHYGATFSMTWRLYGSLPAAVIQRIKAERDMAIAECQKEKLPLEEMERQLAILHGKYYLAYDGELDRATTGPHWLKEPEVAEAIIRKLWQYEGLHYQLDAFCIMSNHVHALLDFSIQLPENELDFDASNYRNLDYVMMLIKGGSSFEANKILARKGRFWEEESWDRYIRNEKHYYTVQQYILNNPVKAGICSHWEAYPYTWCRERGRERGL